MDYDGLLPLILITNTPPHIATVVNTPNNIYNNNLPLTLLQILHNYSSSYSDDKVETQSLLQI